MDKKEKEAIQRAEQAFSERSGYYALEMAASTVAASHNEPLRSGQPSYLIWAKAVRARERGWRVSGGLTHPKDDVAIPVRELQLEEKSFVYLADFIEWAIEAGSPVGRSAIESARQDCELSDTFEHRVRLREIDRTLADLSGAEAKTVKDILNRDTRLAELVRERSEIISSLNGDAPAPERTGTLAANEETAIPVRMNYLRELILDAVRRYGFDESAISGHIAAAAQGPGCDPPCIVAVTAHRITWLNYQGGWTETKRKDFRDRIKRLKKAK